MKVQVLVPTMHQKDFSKLEEQNIKGSVVFANQADSHNYDCVERESGKAEMITTPFRGASKNRNMTIEYRDEDCDLFVLSDDDVVYVDDYEKIIIEEFEKHPDAEAIKFNLGFISDENQAHRINVEKFKKATRRNVTATGGCGLVVKKVVFDRYNMRFNEHFGPGKEVYCAEDTIFLQEMIRKKIVFYLSPTVIAKLDDSESSWFEGFNERYFYCVGQTIANIYPKMAKLIAIRSSYKFSKNKNCNLTFKQIYKSYKQGIKDYLSKK